MDTTSDSLPQFVISLSSQNADENGEFTQYLGTKLTKPNSQKLAVQISSIGSRL